MLVHSVFFYLKKDLSEDQRSEFLSGLTSLTTIEPAELLTVGTPADTHRPVVIRDYDFSLTCIFTDLAQHDAYQIHETHLAFIENCAKFWDKVQIYDAD